MCKISNYINYRAVNREQRLEIGKVLIALLVMFLVLCTMIYYINKSFEECEGILGDTIHMDIRKHRNFDKFQVGRCKPDYHANEKDEKLPFIARFIYLQGSKKMVICSGTLITENLVVTAAHCLLKTNDNGSSTVLKEGELEIHLGGTAEKKFTDTIIVKEYEVHVHPKFNATKKVNDIGLIKFKSSVELTSSVNIACIPFHDMNVPTNLSLAGWGIDNSVDIPKYSEILIPGVGLLNCSQMYYNITMNLYKFFGTDSYNPITMNQFCAGNATRKQGNSGMPVMKRDEKTRSPTIYGLISYGTINMLAEMPTVFTKIHSYRHWILCNA